MCFYLNRACQQQIKTIFKNCSKSPGGSTNSLELLSPFVKSFWGNKTQSVNVIFFSSHFFCSTLSNLLKESREARLNLVDKLLTLLLQQIFAPEPQPHKH